MKIHFAIIAACAGALVLSQAQLAQAQTTPKDPVLIKETTGSGMVAATKKDVLAPKQDENFNTSGSKIKNPTR